MMFTHPQQSTPGTTAASKLGTLSRSLAPLPLVLINTKHFLRCYGSVKIFPKPKELIFSSFLSLFV